VEAEGICVFAHGGMQKVMCSRWGCRFYGAVADVIALTPLAKACL